jgi:hypothetical protein
VRSFLNDNFSENDISLRVQLGKLLEAYKLESNKNGNEWFHVIPISAGLNQELPIRGRSTKRSPRTHTTLIILCGNRAKYVRNRPELVEATPNNSILFRGEAVVTSSWVRSY